MTTEVAHLPVALQKRRRRGTHRLRERCGRGVDRAHQLPKPRRSLAEPLPSLRRDPYRQRRVSDRGLSGDVVQGEEPQPLLERREPNAIGPAPIADRERGQTIDETKMVFERDRRVALLEQLTRDVAHQDREQRVFTLAVCRHPDHGVVDLRRHVAHDPGAPDLQRSQITIARDPHDPVSAVTQRLREVSLTVNRHPLEHRARTGVAGIDHHPRLHPSEQLSA